MKQVVGEAVLKPGWLARQLRNAQIEIATWPISMRQAAGFDDSGLSDGEIREAIKLLRKRIKELEAAYGKG